MDKHEGSHTVEGFIAQFPERTRKRMEEMRALIAGVEPGLTETISYGIPTFDLDGEHVVHFGGYEHHIGFYPTPNGMEEFERELAPYKSGKGTARFPLEEPLPEDLRRRIVEYRVALVKATRKN